MYRYCENGHHYISCQPLPLPPAENSREHPVFLFRRPPQSGRAAFSVTALSQLTAAQEDVSWLDSRRIPLTQTPPAEAAEWLPQGLRAVNFDHPRWREMAAWRPAAGKKRVHILAIGDVGSTIAMGLKLLAGDTVDVIGICDINDTAVKRWEFELNQVTWPWRYDAMPTVEIVPQERLFDCDAFLFVASKGIPPVGSGVQDVRMAQFQANRALVELYARKAREDRFRGLFCVISDPVDPLSRAALLASNRDENGVYDGMGLLPQQIQGYGLGVMNARAAYYAKQDPRFAAFLTEGRAFGPHGTGLVIANSVEHYDDGLSRELTELALTANLKMRELGFKPYVAPALSSAALSVLLTLRGKWHYGSVCLGDMFMGVKNRYTAAGLETEDLPLPDALFRRLTETQDILREII